MPPKPNIVIPRTDKATKEEIEKLKKLLVRKLPANVIDDTVKPLGASENKAIDQHIAPADFKPLNKTYQETSREVAGKVKQQITEVGNLFEGGIANVEITREPVKCDNPVTWLLWLMPELTPYKWQFEALMTTAGYLIPGKYNPVTDKTPITEENPLLLALPCANGSGKDLILIAAFATWFAVIKARNRVIVTSSSYEQIKSQTEVHIRDLCNRANRKFGVLFRSTQFHHIVPELGSEIKLFVTDEPGRAEGYHPFPGGDMALILNETKSITEALNQATERCTGYNRRLEVSSPGGKSGFFYSNVTDQRTVNYPAPVKLGTYYTRKITSFDCPHISASHIERLIYKYGADSPLVRSSVYAEFSDLDEPVVITEYEYNEWKKTKEQDEIKTVGDDIGIGLDIAAGGDEDACFVRKGNTIIHKFFFRQQNLELAASLIDIQLMPWKHLKYVFRADNGGVGMGCIDNLTKLGWHVWRTNNQSPATNKREFLNLGAQQWFHLKRLIARKDIPFFDVDKLQRQLTQRYWKNMNQTQGKYALQSKPEAKAEGKPSPDRADAYVLCYASYHPRILRKEVKAPENNMMNVYEYMRLLSRGLVHGSVNTNKVTGGRFTQLTGKI